MKSFLRRTIADQSPRIAIHGVFLFLLSGAILLAGCAAKPSATTEPVRAVSNQGTLFPTSSEDAQPAVQLLVQVRIYKLLLPVGTVSKSDAFWKHVDEHAVDPATYATLYNNGLRVGVAPTSDWDYFRQIIASQPAVTQRTEFSAVEEKGAEIEMRTGIPYQVLNYMDTTGYLSGRTYDKCDNLMVLAFKPAPRKLGEVRISLCPMVRSTKPRLNFTSMNKEIEQEFLDRDRLYDLNLIADVKLDNVLIIAPSESANLPTSIGNAFLRHAGDAERFEQVLLLVPQEFRRANTPEKGLP